MLVFKSKYDDLVVEHDELKRKSYNEINDLKFNIANLQRENKSLRDRLALLDRMNKGNTVDALIANIEASGKIKCLNYEVQRMHGSPTLVKFDGESYVNQ